MAAAKNTGPAAGDAISRETVTRTSLERGKGAASLYTFGYRELAELLGEGMPGALTERLTKIVGAVLDESFNPASLIELEVARRHGLDWMAAQKEKYTDAWKTLCQLRPGTLREVCSIKPPELPPLYGLDTVWGYGYPDIAAQTTGPLGMSDKEWLRRVWNDGKPGRREFTLGNLRSVASYVGRHQRAPILQVLKLPK